MTCSYNADSGPRFAGPQAASVAIGFPRATLYWTANGADCSGGPYTLCFKTAAAVSGGWSPSATQVIAPKTFTNWVSGDVGLLGQFSMGQGYAFVACGIVRPGAGPYYFNTSWSVEFNICVIPL